MALSLALVLLLALGPVGPCGGCLQCDPNFSLRFASYAPHLSRKAWGLGVVPAAGRMLRGWAQDTLRGLQLGVPAEIPMMELQMIATKVYAKLDTLFQGKLYKPGALPEVLHSIFEEQVRMLRNAILESRVKCERHCGINQYKAINCETCNQTKPTCFGYNCESSEAWETALKGLYKYINDLGSQPQKWAVGLKQLPGFSHCTSTSPDNLNFTSIGKTLSQNWLNMMALKDLEGQVSSLQMLAPSC
ncbi:izumo sperm-egg fusion protein 4-like [Anolis sagrei]|uniref:izumo sperm-egg fusion protein 4-like n=1 Tax=Anolis sagrei TaxID=38937 RepID=UPI00351FABE7